jgi:hypothetical protein
MRFAGNFHPEWGHLAPAPSFMRTARIVAVATAIGATAGAAVVLSLAGTSAFPPQAEAGTSPVVVHSLVQPAAAAPSVALLSATPDAAPPPTPSAAMQTYAKPSVQPSATLMPAPAAQISAPSVSESRSASTSAAPASVAALAEIPPVTEASPLSGTDQATFAPDQTGAPSTIGKKQRATDQTTQHGTQPAAVAARRRSEDRGLGPLLRHLFSARAGSSYYPN